MFGLLVGLARGLVFAFVGWFVVGLTYGLIVGLARGLTAGLSGWFMFGLIFGLAGGLRSKGHEPSRVQMQISSRGRQILGKIVIGLVGGLVIGSVAGLVVGLTRGLVFGLVIGLVFGLVFGLARGLETPIDIRTVVSPSDLLTTDRQNTIFKSLVGGFVVGLVGGLIGGLLVGGTGGLVGVLVLWSFVGLVGGLAGVLVFGFGESAWGRWLILARIWLPLTGRLPWAVAAFLDDAHQRGVLRQAGAVYQFRHAQLQDHLADSYRARRRGGFTQG